MMILKIQIYSLIYNVFFGLFFNFFVRINYKYIYNVKLFTRIVFTFIFVFVNVLLYFICLKCINNGVLHFYFCLCILFGFYIGNLIFSKLNVKKSKV